MATRQRFNKVRSQKHALVDKANAVMIFTIAATSVIVVFSLFAIRALVSQYSYQNKVIGQKKDTLEQVKESRQNVSQLVSAYQGFANEPINVIGGNPDGEGPKDGDNPRIVLDALPSKYDFPGLISSLEKLLTTGGYRIESIGGSEQEGAGGEEPGPSPSVIEIPFPVSITASYQNAQAFLSTLEASIRPIHITKLILSGTDADMRITLEAKTFYQPEKTFDVTSEVVQ